MEEGFPHYHETCRLCHEGPGYLPAEFAEGLYPHPPGMTAGHLQEALSDAEIYWIVKHGLKMTGMPTFGPTPDEEQLWGIVAIVEEIPPDESRAVPATGYQVDQPGWWKKPWTLTRNHRGRKRFIKGYTAVQ